MYSLLLTAAGALFFSSATPTAASTPKPATHTVVIEGLQFSPQVLTVKAGDSVVWINHDPFPHTATAYGGMFDSRKIATGRSWKYTVRKTGVFPYACSLHPTMLATLRVE
jgi:plastocyanin